jgi:hypothetical protein
MNTALSDRTDDAHSSTETVAPPPPTWLDILKVVGSIVLCVIGAILLIGVFFGTVMFIIGFIWHLAIETYNFLGYPFGLPPMIPS